MRALVVAILLAGCGAPVDEPTAELSQAVGEPNGAFPSPEERLGIMAINRARSDPTTLKGAQSTIYPPRPPVLWSYDLSRSSRFHANSLEIGKVTLMHTSPCKLNANIATNNCSGDPACGCATPIPAMCSACANVPAINTCGTDTFTRIGYFTANTGTSATGEVGAAGYVDPIAVVNGWVDEAAGADGHRRNLLDQGIVSNVMGYGHAAGANCWSTFDFSDSGSANVQIPKLPTAAVTPVRGAAGAYTFYATWADPVSGAPASLNVVVDGNCTPMARELGTDTLNATYKAAPQLAAGCHTYWMLAKDAGGARLTYPTTGAITISVGGVACNAEYVAQAPAAGCDSMMAIADMATAGPLPDLAGTPPRDLAGTPPRDLAGSKGTGGDDGGPINFEVHGGCGCSVGERAPHGAAPALLLIALLVGAIRRGGAKTLLASAAARTDRS